MKRLESISYEIHERRNLRNSHRRLEQRGVGVGAESPATPSSPQLSETLRKLQLSEATPIGSSISEHPRSVPPGLPWFYNHSNSSYTSSRANSDRDDCDSVASGDTLDTLDDSTIEKLMLEPTLETEYREIYSGPKSVD